MKKESYEENTFYSRIKKFRKAKKMTIKELAEKANITSSMLSQIERGLANPSINTMKLIANALEVPLFKFFMEEEGDIRSQVVTPENRKRIYLPDSNGVIYELLTPDLAGTIEFCQLTLEPYMSTSDNPMGHEGEEVAIVISGTAELILDDSKIIMEAGDSIRIPPHTNHKWYNPEDEPLVLIFAITPPSF